MKRILSHRIIKISWSVLIVMITFLAIILGRYTEVCLLFLLTLLLGWRYHKLYFNRNILLLEGGLFMYSVCVIFLIGYNWDKFLQQFILLFIVTTGYQQVFFYSGLSIKEWFEKYITVVYILSLLGISQVIIYAITSIDIFLYTIDGFAIQPSIRLHSIMLEPGFFTTFTIPAFSYVFLEKSFFKEHKIKSIIIVLAFVLTFAVAAWVALLFVLCTWAYRKFKYFKPLIILLMISLSVWFVNNANSFELNKESASLTGDIKNKVIQTMTVIESTDPSDFEKLNLSSYAILTNYWIAFNAPNRFCGTGLGTHSQNYELLYQSDYAFYGLNKEEAYSLFARLYSEFGIIGVYLYILFLIKCYTKKNVISICLLIFFLSYLIKGGHYTLYGVVFFHLLYYFVYIDCCKYLYGHSK